MQIIVGQVKQVLIILRAVENLCRVLSKGKHAQICVKIILTLACAWI